MKKSYIYIPSFFWGMFLLILFAGGTLSCKKEVYYEWPKGTLTGSVSLQSSPSYNWVKGQGVLVKVEGSSPLAQTTCDENGNFSIENLETGIYDIVFSKAGYTTTTLYSFQFVGGKVPYSAGHVDLYLATPTNFTLAKPKVLPASYSHGYSNTFPPHEVNPNTSMIQFHPILSFNKP
ncbi:MAG TPA: hypothetical protein VHO72_03905 [Bacteroidales bacterium]|nr:hypothetical protein [Bacteroidales bacterium]